MEISTMVLDIRKKIEALDKEYKVLFDLHEDLTRQLGTVKESLRSNMDENDALKMALEALESIGTKKKEAVVKDPAPAPTPPPKKQTPPPVQKKDLPIKESKKAKKVLKLDERGNQLAIYRTLAECANDNNMGFQNMLNIIEKGDKATMLQTRGYYFRYA